MSGDIVVIHDAISDKYASAIQFFSQFAAGFALGLYKGWKLTLVLFFGNLFEICFFFFETNKTLQVILAVTPVLAISAGVMMFLIGQMTTAGQKSYAKAGAVALEALTGFVRFNDLFFLL